MSKLLIILFLIMLIGCGDGGDSTTKEAGGKNQPCYPNNTCNEPLICSADSICIEKSSPCSGVSCGANSSCNETTGGCDCNSGFHDENGSCVADITDLCEGKTCGDHSSCDTKTGNCICDSGFHDENGSCVADVVDPCKEVTCGDHGSCKVVADKATCECDTGYNAEGLNCVKAAICSGDDTQTLVCGLNNRGSQKQICTEGLWVNDGDCIDEDECIDDAIRETACGFNNNGKLTEQCKRGLWETDGTCIDPDQCKNGTEEEIATCGVGNHTTGPQLRICQEGAWIIEPCNTWLKAWGTEDFDDSGSIVVDANGDLYLTYTLQGDYNGTVSLGGFDIIVTRMDRNGETIWEKRLGTDKDDFVRTITIDPEGYLYLIGKTYGTLDGESNYGKGDAFVIKLNQEGTPIWQRQFGSDKHDHTTAIAFDSGANAYVGYISSHESNYIDVNGFTYLMKLNKNGGMVWKNYLEWGNYFESLIVNNRDEIYPVTLVLTPDYELGKMGYSTFLYQFSTEGGEPLFTREIGFDRVFDMTIDHNQNFYLIGRKSTYLGYEDILLRKYNPAATFQWDYVIESGVGTSVVAGKNNTLYLTGYIHNSFTDTTSAGGNDFFITKLEQTDTEAPKAVWNKQWGTTGNEYSESTFIDFDNQEHHQGPTLTIYEDELFLFGTVSDTLYESPYSGEYDLFLIKTPDQK